MIAVNTKLSSFRFPPEEKKEWEKAAKDAGKTLTNWLRDLANEAAGTPVPRDLLRDSLIEAQEQKRRKRPAKSSSDCDSPPGRYCYVHDTRHV